MRSQKGLVIGGDPRAASLGELSAWESPCSPSESGDRGRGAGRSPWEGQPHQYPCFLVMGQAGVLPVVQCMKVNSESEVAQSCLTLRDPMDCSPPGFSVHGTFQARVLEWGAIAFSEPSH